VATAAGASSRRLQYPSMITVDFGCFSRTSVKSASGGNCYRANVLAPEVAHHQSVHDRATFAFDSRRLHQFPSMNVGLNDWGGAQRRRRVRPRGSSSPATGGLPLPARLRT